MGARTIMAWSPPSWTTNWCSTRRFLQLGLVSPELSGPELAGQLLCQGRAPCGKLDPGRSPSDAPSATESGTDHDHQLRDTAADRTRASRQRSRPWPGGEGGIPRRLYRQDRIAHHQLAEALGLDRYETDGVLKRHKVSPGVSAEETRAQAAALQDANAR